MGGGKAGEILLEAVCAEEHTTYSLLVGARLDVTGGGWGCGKGMGMTWLQEPQDLFLFRDTMLKLIRSDNLEHKELTKAA